MGPRLPNTSSSQEQNSNPYKASALALLPPTTSFSKMWLSNPDPGGSPPHPGARQQPTVEAAALLSQLGSSASCHLFSPELPLSPVAHLCLRPPLSTLSLLPAQEPPPQVSSGVPIRFNFPCEGIPTPSPGVKLPFSITCSAHGQMTSAAAAASSSIPLPFSDAGPLGRSAPSASTSRPSGGGQGGVHPHPAAPQHAPVPPPLPPSGRRPNPHPAAARPPEPRTHQE
jgi:hypothetical protein